MGLLLFTLINSADIFILLKAKEAGVNDMLLIGMYIFYNLVYAIFAFPAGVFADKAGLKTTFVTGLAIFTLVYMGIAVNKSVYGFFALFFLYGMYAAATEGVSKAWISNITHKQHTATAIGTYSALQSICSMLASSLMGVCWYLFGSTVAFLITALLTFGVLAYFLFVRGLQNKLSLL